MNAASSAASWKFKGNNDRRSAEYLEEVYELNQLLDALALIRASDADAGVVARCVLSIFHLDDELCRYDYDVGKLIEKMKNPRYGISCWCYVP